MEKLILEYEDDDKDLEIELEDGSLDQLYAAALKQGISVEEYVIERLEEYIQSVRNEDSKK